MIDAINHGSIDGAALLPHVLEEIAGNEEAVEKISRLNYIDWVGGEAPRLAVIVTARLMETQDPSPKQPAMLYHPGLL